MQVDIRKREVVIFSGIAEINMAEFNLTVFNFERAAVIRNVGNFVKHLVDARHGFARHGEHHDDHCNH